MQIKFTKNVRYETEGRNKGPVFEAGEVHDFREDIAQRWLRRKVAEVHVAQPEANSVPVAPPKELVAQTAQQRDPDPKEKGGRSGGIVGRKPK
jgi:hypothetical protein